MRLTTTPFRKALFSLAVFPWSASPTRLQHTMSNKNALVVPAVKNHSATVIVAHGLGDRVSLAENWRRRGKFDEVKFIFPNAPVIPITLNGGLPMPGWYDIGSLGNLNAQEDESGILRSRDVFTKLIEDEVAGGIPSHRIVLGGFSQGGAMSLITGVTTTHKLAGVFALSSYLVLASKVKELAAEAKDANKETTFFVAHGDADEVVKYQWGQQSAEFLRKELGHKVEFKTYPGLPHSADPDEINDLETFIRTALAETK
ncbi:hypothetical protein DV738_g2234, partial [Chaetothyriales sp. CBS 135597]